MAESNAQVLMELNSKISDVVAPSFTVSAQYAGIFLRNTFYISGGGAVAVLGYLSVPGNAPAIPTLSALACFSLAAIASIVASIMFYFSQDAYTRCIQYELNCLCRSHNLDYDFRESITDQGKVFRSWGQGCIYLALVLFIAGCVFSYYGILGNIS